MYELNLQAHHTNNHYHTPNYNLIIDALSNTTDVNSESYITKPETKNIKMVILTLV